MWTWRLFRPDQDASWGTEPEGWANWTRYVKQDVVEREQEIQGEQETEHQALDGRDWEQEVINTEILDYLAYNIRWC